jgi:hypothetical protein
LLAAARELETLDPSLARATCLEAVSAATLAGRLVHGGGLVEVSKAALAGPPAPEEPQPSDLLLQGLAVRATEGYAAGAPLLVEALNVFQRDADLLQEEARWLWFASLIALFMWDDNAWTVLFTRQLELARETGALSALTFALGTGIGVYAFFGELTTAALLEEEQRAATEATGIAANPNGALSLAAVHGREAEFSELLRTTIWTCPVGDEPAGSPATRRRLVAFRRSTVGSVVRPDPGYANSPIRHSPRAAARGDREVVALAA